MTGTIAITDEGWYRFLLARPEVTELNFWTPSARRWFRAPPFSPFLFKLRAPDNAICGFAYFAQFSKLPDWLAWDTFGEGVTPVFFPPDAWVPQPADWQPRTQVPVKYDLAEGEGRRVWEACLARASALPGHTRAPDAPIAAEHLPRYGDPRLVQPRLGQATFRIAVLDAYGRACAVTEEHSLPALEAAHIRSYSDDGPHAVPNGLLLRADLHRLFDKGYITVTPDLRLEVGARLRDEYHNGRSYYPLHGARLHLPVATAHQPRKEFLDWHNEHVFRG